MKVLICDTSTQVLYCFFYDTELGINIYEKILQSNNNHSENLVKVIEEGLNLTKLKMNDFQKIIIGVGPGAYTGLRVSMVVVKMASHFLNIPIYTISSLFLLGSFYFKNDGNYLVYSKAIKDCFYCLEVNVSNNIITYLKDLFVTKEELSLFKNRILINDFILDSNIINNYAIEACEVTNLVPNYIRSGVSNG